MNYKKKKTESFDEKLKMFKEIFFPFSLKAEVNDVQKSPYPDPMQNRLIIDENEIKSVIKKTKPDKASEFDEISNKILKIMANVLSKKLTPIFQTCVNLAYHPRVFKEAHTITLKKTDKKDYITPKVYRPIALLNIMKKILKSIMTQRLINMAETDDLLPHNQMRARRGREIDTALQFLIEQIHII